MSLPRITERAFQAQVVRLAKCCRWLVYHTHDSRRSQPGFPDLVLVKDRVVMAELKSETGRVSREQSRWIDALAQAGAEVYVWNPGDWDEIVEVLGVRRADR